jgi:pyroglutamyl-peptidase
MDTSRRDFRVLLSAFDAYTDGANVYCENASRLALEQLVSRPPQDATLDTRIYSVDFGTIRQRIEQDIASGYDLMILTGQAVSSGHIRLETQAKNLGRDPNGSGGTFPLAFDGPPMAGSTINWPLIIAALPEPNLQIALSNDAGDYLCNAALYFAVLAAERRWKSGIGELPTKVGFIHVPLAPQQTRDGEPSMPKEETSHYLREILQKVAAII